MPVAALSISRIRIIKATRHEKKQTHRYQLPVGSFYILRHKVLSSFQGSRQWLHKPERSSEYSSHRLTLRPGRRAEVGHNRIYHAYCFVNTQSHCHFKNLKSVLGSPKTRPTKYRQIPWLETYYPLPDPSPHSYGQQTTPSHQCREPWTSPCSSHTPLHPYSHGSYSP